MQHEIKTERLVLVPCREGDVDTVWGLWNQPGVRRYLFDDREVTREVAADVLGRMLAEASTGGGMWLLERKDDGGRVGVVALFAGTTMAKLEPRLPVGLELLVALDETAWGAGYAGEACRAVKAYGRETLGAGRLVAGVDVPNGASRRLMERLGFREFSEVAGPKYRLVTYVCELG